MTLLFFFFGIIYHSIFPQSIFISFSRHHLDWRSVQTFKQNFQFWVYATYYLQQAFLQATHKFSCYDKVLFVNIYSMTNIMLQLTKRFASQWNVKSLKWLVHLQTPHTQLRVKTTTTSVGSNLKNWQQPSNFEKITTANWTTINIALSVHKITLQWNHVSSMQITWSNYQQQHLDAKQDRNRWWPYSRAL